MSKISVRVQPTGISTCQELAEANLTATTAADKGDVFILDPDGGPLGIADAFQWITDVTATMFSGQVPKKLLADIIDGKQSMTVFKDVRQLVLIRSAQP
jgi:putative multiple sugar transport system substrate-binding protein